MKRTLAVDFDGVLHEYNPGDWEGIGVTNGRQVPRAAQSLRLLSKDYKIVIHSCRAIHPDGVEAIRRFCAQHQIPFDDITVTKPHAALYIDDRAHEFRSWGRAMQAIRVKLEGQDA